MYKLTVFLCTVFIALSQDNLSSLKWMTGFWAGEGLGGSSEEIWSQPDENGLFGIFKQSNNGKVMFYEFFVLTKNGKNWSLKLKHFTSEMVGWEKKEKYIEFPVLRMTETSLECEGISYKKISENEIHAEVLIDDDSGPRKETFKFRRMK